MGKALAVQSARNGLGGMRAYGMGRAKLHTSRVKEARAVDAGTLFGAEKEGKPSRSLLALKDTSVRAQRDPELINWAD